MRTILIVIALLAGGSTLQAQRCLDISITSLLKSLPIPDSSGGSFKKCTVQKNDKKQAVIDNYGQDLILLDTQVAQTGRKFTLVSVGDIAGYKANMPSQEDISDAKALAEKVKNMTPEQQKEFAMQVAAQSRQNATPSAENPANLQTLMQTQTIVQTQMKSVSDDFIKQYQQIKAAAEADKKSLPPPDKSKCTQDKVGMIDCKCSNKAEAIYWRRLVPLVDKYNAQKKELLKEYMSKMTALCSQVEANILKLRNGDALTTPNYKKLLLSVQASAYAQAYGQSVEAIKEIRSSGSDAYVVKQNSENGVYAMDCDSQSI